MDASLQKLQPTWATEDGSIKLYLGDCRTILPALEAGSVDLLWTDPPYGHSNGDGDFLDRRDEIMRDGRATVQEPIANDDQESMREVVDQMLAASVSLLKKDCCCCCCCGGGGPSPTFAWVAHRLDRGGYSFFHSVIWDKRNPGVGWRYRRQHEMVMVAHRTGGKLAWSGDLDALPNIIQTSKPREQYHPNEKPLALVSRFVIAHASQGDLVLDPFMGSGTTGVSCIRTGRRFTGIEQDPKHFATAVDRITAELNSAPLFEPPAKIVQREIFA